MIRERESFVVQHLFTFVCLSVCLFDCCFYPSGEYFARVETSLLTARGCNVCSIRPVSREGSLSCCCDTGPRFLRTHLNDRSISRFVQQATITANYSKPDTHCPMQRTVPFSCLLHQITTRNGKCICVTIQVLRLFL